MKSSLRLKLEVIGKDKGAKSIQINVLDKFLAQREFSSLKVFADTYDIEYNRSKKRLENFKLFIIMDTDDCTMETRESYICCEMFRKSILADYICPIYSIPKLEDVMLEVGLMKESPTRRKNLSTASCSQFAMTEMRELFMKLKRLPTRCENQRTQILKCCWITV